MGKYKRLGFLFLNFFERQLIETSINTKNQGKNKGSILLSVFYIICETVKKITTKQNLD